MGSHVDQWTQFFAISCGISKSRAHGYALMCVQNKLDPSRDLSAFTWQVLAPKLGLQTSDTDKVLDYVKNGPKGRQEGKK